MHTHSLPRQCKDTLVGCACAPRSTLHVQHRPGTSQVRLGGKSGPCTAAAQCNAQIYVGRMPLVGWERLASGLGPDVGQLLYLHTFVLIELQPEEVWLFDFLPADPTSPQTAASLLTGQAVKGVARQRKVRRAPTPSSLRCVGTSSLEDPLQTAAAFNRGWAEELQLLRRDCRQHTQQLLEVLKVVT